MSLAVRSMLSVGRTKEIKLCTREAQMKINRPVHVCPKDIDVSRVF